MRLKNKITLAFLLGTIVVGVGAGGVEAAIGFTYKYFTIIPGGIYAETGPSYKIGDNIAIKIGLAGGSVVAGGSLAIVKNLSTAPVEANGLPKGISFVNGEFLGVAQMPTSGPSGTNQNYSYIVEGTTLMTDGSTQAYSGTAQFQIKAPPCSPQISAPYYSQDYIKDTKLNRSFLPVVPVNPFDDFVVDIDLTICPVTDIFTPSLTTANTSGVVTTILTGSSTPGNLIYQWKVKGWPNGIVADQVKMEMLVDSIVKGRPIKIEVKKVGGSTIPAKDITKDLTQCVRLYGNGTNAVTYLREQGIKTNIPGGSIYNMVAATMNNVDYFNSKAPFNAPNTLTGGKTMYRNEFRHTLNLREFVEPAWRDSDSGTNEQMVFDNFFANIDFSSPIFECGIPVGNNQYFSSVVVGVTNFLPSFQSRGVTLGSKVLLGDQFFYPLRNYVLFHELGHAFGKLVDEYLYPVKTNNFVTPPKNCSTNPQGDFSFGVPPLNYAPFSQLGCHALKTVSPGAIMDVFRSSKDSIMNDGGSEDFNVVSCGWVLKLLKGQVSAHSLFPECNAMPGIEK